MRLILLPTYDITIPNSQLSNTETHQSNSIIRENRGQQPITFKDTTWPVNIIHRYTIRTMNEDERDDLINMLIATAGQEITIIDHDNYTWIGVIITAIPELVTMKDLCSYDIEFEFMGWRVA